MSMKAKIKSTLSFIKAQRSKITAKAYAFIIEYPFIMIPSSVSTLEKQIIAAYAQIYKLIKRQDNGVEMDTKASALAVNQELQFKIQQLEDRYGKEHVDQAFPYFQDGSIPLKKIIEALGVHVQVYDEKYEEGYSCKPSVSQEKFPYIISILKYEGKNYYPIFSKEFVTLFDLDDDDKSTKIEDIFFSPNSMFNFKGIEHKLQQIKNKELELQKVQMRPMLRANTINSALATYKKYQAAVRYYQPKLNYIAYVGFVDDKHDEVLHGFSEQLQKDFDSKIKNLPYYLAAKKARAYMTSGTCKKCSNSSILIERFANCNISSANINICGECLCRHLQNHKSYDCPCNEHKLNVYQVSLADMYNAVLGKERAALIFIPLNNFEMSGFQDIMPNNNPEANNMADLAKTYHPI